jgi:hypothetical protein
MLIQFAPILLLVTAVIGHALPEKPGTSDPQFYPSASDQQNAVFAVWHPFNETKLSKRSGERYTTLPDGNLCDILVQGGSGTEGWTTADFGNLYGAAGNALTSAISRNNRPNVGLTLGFTDHAGRTHQVDCEATTTGQASVSIDGAYQNVDQALVAAEQLADSDWTGLIGTSRSTLRVFFGSAVAISIAVNVLN